jgi:hypothetical protein
MAIPICLSMIALKAGSALYEGIGVCPHLGQSGVYSEIVYKTREW